MTRRVFIVGLLLFTGCAKDQSQPLTGETFFNPTVVEESPQSSIDQPGPIANNQVNMDLLESAQERQRLEQSGPPSVRAVSPAVREAVREPTAAASTTATPTSQQTAATGVSDGAGAAAGYTTVGSVIAMVN